MAQAARALSDRLRLPGGLTLVVRTLTAAEARSMEA